MSPVTRQDVPAPYTGCLRCDTDGPGSRDRVRELGRRAKDSGRSQPHHNPRNPSSSSMADSRSPQVSDVVPGPPRKRVPPTDELHSHVIPLHESLGSRGPWTSMLHAGSVTLDRDGSRVQGTR